MEEMYDEEFSRVW